MSFEEWLNGELNDAEREAKESHSASMNSYGAGYDAGYLAALKVIAYQMSPEMARASVGDC